MMYGGKYMKEGKEGPKHEMGESEDEKCREYGVPDTSGMLGKIMDSYKGGSVEPPKKK